jgi:hypothetical protein
MRRSDGQTRAANGTASLGLLMGMVLVLVGNVVVAQEQKDASDAELRSEVPALSRFHEVVYKLWHTAWPEKDTTMLLALAPELDKLGNDVCSSELPGILRDKKPEWDRQVKQFRLILDRYNEAVVNGDGRGLLSAAEGIHSQFEMMVRVIRPPFKELEQFHSALYPLYHYFKPQKDREKVLTSIAQLNERMKVLDETSLPDRLKTKGAAFAKARTKLAKAVAALSAVSTTNDWMVIDQNIETVHSRYEECAGVFE